MSSGNNGENSNMITFNISNMTFMWNKSYLPSDTSQWAKVCALLKQIIG